MLYKLSIALAVASSAAALVETTPDPEWEAYKMTYKKTYSSQADEDERHELFKASKTRVAALNKANAAAGDAFGINWMSDRCVWPPHAARPRALPRLRGTPHVPPFFLSPLPVALALAARRRRSTRRAM